MIRAFVRRYGFPAALLLAACAGCTIEMGNTPEEEPYTPVLTPGTAGSWDEKNVADPCVLHDPHTGTYTMYYSGCNTQETYCIGYAVSSDGISWTKPDLGHGDNVCLRNGGTGTWNESGVVGPWVLQVGSTYHMWYAGYDSNRTFQVGYASSTDGKAWSPLPSPVLSPSGSIGAFDERGVLGIAVWYEQDTATYHVYYTGMDAEGKLWIAYTSTSTPTLISNAPGPLSQFGPASNTYHVGGLRSPALLYDPADSLLKMWPTAVGAVGSVTYASSSAPDTGWTLRSTPVLTDHSTGFDADSVGLCSVILDPSGTGFRMWYSGWSSEGIAIGYAVSPDGWTWTKYR